MPEGLRDVLTLIGGLIVIGALVVALLALFYLWFGDDDGRAAGL